MSQRVASLEYLGIVASRLRKDAVSSQDNQESVDEIIAKVNCSHCYPLHTQTCFSPIPLKFYLICFSHSVHIYVQFHISQYEVSFLLANEVVQHEECSIKDIAKGLRDVLK